MSSGNKKIHSYCMGGVFIFFLFVIAVTSFAYAGDEHDKITNAYCPVMPDMQTNPEIFSEYENKRVYFCCNNCKATFGREPEKYLGLLPQFGGTLARMGQGHRRGIELGKLIEPMGIITLLLLVLTAGGQLFRKKVPKFLLRWHKRLGIFTLISALIHASLVLIAH